MPESITQLTERFDLQIALLAIGAFLIIVLLLYNFVRTQKLKKQLMNSMAKAIVSEKLDAQHETISEPYQGMDVSKIEPNFTESSFVDKDLSPGLSSLTTPESLPSDSGDGQSSYSSRMDPSIDCVVVLRFALLVSGKEILERMFHWPSNNSYRIATEGLYEFEGSTVWELINEQHVYREIQLSMQLANRRGPIGQEGLSEFLGLGAELASEIDAEIDLPPISQVLFQAQDLDHFTVQCDIQLGFNLVPNMISWSPKEVETSLYNNRFVLSRDGLFFNYVEDQILLFKVQIPGLNFLTDDLQNFRIKSILFALDVPLVPEHINAFSIMLEVSLKIAQELDGKVLDDNGQILELASVNTIIAQLEPIYLLMRERQIFPGSPSAARLFS